MLSTAGVGAAFGWHRGLFYIAGLCLGTNIGGLAVISGVAAIILAEPLIRIVLLFVSAAYLGYLALRIGLAGTKNCLYPVHRTRILSWTDFGFNQS